MVTWLAVFLFAIITILELVIVVWIPMHLRTASLWEKESAYQEMIELEDQLRANFSAFAKKNKGIADGEINIIRICLDDYARYIRTYGNGLTRNQIRDIYQDLKEFENIYFQIKNNNFAYTVHEKIDKKKYISHLLEDCGVKKPAETGLKKGTSGENEKRKTGKDIK